MSPDSEPLWGAFKHTGCCCCFSIPWILSDGQPTGSVLSVIKPSFAHAREPSCLVTVLVLSFPGGDGVCVDGRLAAGACGSTVSDGARHCEVWPRCSVCPVRSHCLQLPRPADSARGILCSGSSVYPRDICGVLAAGQALSVGSGEYKLWFLLGRSFYSQKGPNMRVSTDRSPLLYYTSLPPEGPTSPQGLSGGLCHRPATNLVLPSRCLNCDVERVLVCVVYSRMLLGLSHPCPHTCTLIHCLAPET